MPILDRARRYDPSWRRGDLVAGLAVAALVVISFDGVDFIDSQGSAKLAEILDLADTYGAQIRLARVKPAVYALLSCDDVIAKLGPQHVNGNVYEACADRITEHA